MTNVIPFRRRSPRAAVKPSPTTQEMTRMRRQEEALRKQKQARTGITPPVLPPLDVDEAREAAESWGDSEHATLVACVAAERLCASCDPRDFSATAKALEEALNATGFAVDWIDELIDSCPRGEGFLRWKAKADNRESWLKHAVLRLSAQHTPPDLSKVLEAVTNASICKAHRGPRI